MAVCNGTLFMVEKILPRKGIIYSLCVCISILVITFPEWLNGMEPLPHTLGAVRPSSLCL